ncbi:PPC domain-containing protein, partial [Streptomyces scabiei]
ENELSNGQTVNVSGAQGSNTFYKLVVPTGTNSLTFDTSGGSGDVDLYVQAGQKPSTSSYSCRPYKNGNTENCTFSNPQAGDWW